MGSKVCLSTICWPWYAVDAIETLGLATKDRVGSVYQSRSVRLSKIGSERLIGRCLVLLLSEFVGCYASKNQNDSLPSSNLRAPQQKAGQSSNCGSFEGYVGVGGYKGMGIYIYGRGDIA